MPEYLSPGVYMEEVDTGSKTIEGVSTSTVGMIGVTKRSPEDGLPVLVTSFADFKRNFGGYFDFGFSQEHQYLPYAVEGFFRNGGKRVFIKRVPGTGAIKSTVTAKGEPIVTRIKADVIEEGVSAITVKLATLRGIYNDLALTLKQVKDGIVTDEIGCTVTSYDRTRMEATLDITGGDTDVNLKMKYTTVELSGTRNNTFVINARDKGSWGDDIIIKAFPESAAGAELEEKVDDRNLRLNSTRGFYINAWIEIDNGVAKNYRRISEINGKVIIVDEDITDAVMDLSGTSPIYISTCEFGISVSYESISEHFTGLTLENVPGRYYVDIINKQSVLIIAGEPDSDAVTGPIYFPCGDDGVHIIPGSGSDGSAPADGDYIGVDDGPGTRSGIKAMVDIDQVSIVVVPGITSTAVQNELITHCELLMDRFAILDLPSGNNNIMDVEIFRRNYDTKYAALYYPWVKTWDPLTKTSILIPPSGHIAGIYARTDIERGVHKAPANAVVRGITGLEFIVNKGEQDILNPMPNNINVIRDFRKNGRGYRVWGARCITSDPDWKYINVRRLFIFIEESIEESTHWVVFEPNNEATWSRVKRTVKNFLTGLWRDGALQGSTVNQAFFVRCDRTTMTQADIDNGRLIMEIGIAPVKPAEFVIFRIGQWSAGSSVEEV
ncbi:MAG: phage tail sheath subtilisin-like domain-containing protein [Spirochaetales bacterium]|nr:phage tail sheath subtilisin-like domain-containing protein [Spirochaetales bacterium]